ncbi:hypothetical protein DM992_10995 [Burkholderia sp. JP2-270]|nr:hypothetical protein DM992_10995 [Burkholderia sp. JP2-270]
MSGSNGGSIQRKSTVVQFEFVSRSWGRIGRPDRGPSPARACLALWRLAAPYGSHTAVGNT